MHSRNLKTNILNAMKKRTLQRTVRRHQVDRNHFIRQETREQNGREASIGSDLHWSLRSLVQLCPANSQTPPHWAENRLETVKMELLNKPVLPKLLLGPEGFMHPQLLLSCCSFFSSGNACFLAREKCAFPADKHISDRQASQQSANPELYEKHLKSLLCSLTSNSTYKHG